MEANIKGFSLALLDVIQDNDALGAFIDGTDPVRTNENGHECTFTASKQFEARLQGPRMRRGPGGLIPIGEVVYTVTITASVAVADEDEDGFLHNGVWVRDPNMDERQEYPVNPWEHYGESYRTYRTKKGLPVPLLSE